VAPYLPPGIPLVETAYDPPRRDPEDDGPEEAVNLRIEEPELEASGLN